MNTKLSKKCGKDFLCSSYEVYVLISLVERNIYMLMNSTSIEFHSFKTSSVLLKNKWFLHQLISPTAQDLKHFFQKDK